MDKIKQAASSLGGSGHKEVNTQGGAGKQDYVDKAFDAGVKKSGHSMDRNTQEKVTDAGRGMFEKQTGKNVPHNVSN
ncbi:hypothetical protein D7B24_001230 [Verticillium nonalfalfae]|uniref:Uncharacterized protein n=3 Tax=Verticillium TaxID=1036719 RepID=A0A2J8FTY8_VERDA|nr:predicted protein [Verticillium alfalfae VaMs.102]XP_028492084.1 uncharacterized protein D7B24_001230 [Verticillium nonalfalfae]KAF3349895.1 hypothetical protein VdG2_01710 [Verticillium dahliae VDG2]KAF3357078.1 hypothetical protein VdG1_06095 [Verticillium dahliae VDG1]KAG7115282.1 hypothetical protein HYQ44_007800 [Verticillium longisporum]PNH30948.1 hypothetical protein BJF96_g5757 [Verticillium dahliae]EEY17138.1 predicted protein [Verticillium alfalfae VaMs.102]